MKYGYCTAPQAPMTSATVPAAAGGASTYHRRHSTTSDDRPAATASSITTIGAGAFSRSQNADASQYATGMAIVVSAPRTRLAAMARLRNSSRIGPAERVVMYDAVRKPHT